MYFYKFYYVWTYLIFFITYNIFNYYTYGIIINKNTSFITYTSFDHCNYLRRTKFSLNEKESEHNKYVDNFLKSIENKNLFKNQVYNFEKNRSEIDNLSISQSWSEIVRDEILKNKHLESIPDDSPKVKEDPDEDLHNLRPKKSPYKYRLSPEGRLRLEDRIENLKRTAHSNPVKYKEERPNLWIVRSSHGNYCDLLEKDEDKIKSLVNRVRKFFTPSELQILVMKVNIKMPLCEIMFEGTMPDLVRIFYARGGTLQYYVCPKFWTRCELLEKDPRLEAKYGKSTAPGLFPQWDEDGMMEEIMDCMDTRPDYALEFIMPNAWQLIPMLPDFDKRIMKEYFDNVHWPTRLRVQKAFENGIEDYRTVIEQEYESLQNVSRKGDGLLDLWMSKPDEFD